MKSLALKLIAAVLALAPMPALAQATYPTSSATAPKVDGVVPLQCNSGVTACTPIIGTNPLPVHGAAAASATDSGNPLKVGCRHDTSRPVYTNGQRTNCQSDTRGAIYVTLAAPDSASAGLSDGNGVASTPGLAGNTWSYSNGATGILSNTTTAVTIKTAGGAGIRNYIDSCTINTTAFGASVPIAIRDGAGGTVLFAVSVPTAGYLQPVNIVFQQPLRGTANTLLEVVTTSANTSGTAWVNCQGHTGT